jgi:hypothetical protein
LRKPRRRDRNAILAVPFQAAGEILRPPFTSRNPAGADRPRGEPSAFGAVVNRVFQTLMIVATGVLLGQQYARPDKRVIPVIVSVLLLGFAWRLDMVTAIGVLVVALPYPRFTVFGTTNIALTLVLTIFWLVRVSMRQLPVPRRSPVDMPLVGLFILYVLSFNNVPPEHFEFAFPLFELFLGSVIMFFLIVNNVRTEEDLVRIHNAQLICAATVFLVAIWELNHPGQDFIPGWINFRHTRGSDFGTRNVRVGSTFYDYELLSEFSAITLWLGLFRWVRAKSGNERGVYSGFLLLNLFILFATVTRGAFISLAASIPMLLWTLRRRIKVVPLTIVVATSAALLFGMNFYVANFTRSGDVFARMGSTRIVHGWMPDDRAEAWVNAWNRALVHPLVGQGPYYWDLPGFRRWWPHNVYLYYANIVGFIGLGFFLAILVILFRLTRSRVDSLTHPSYAEAYLIIARAQFILFVVNEFKIDYLRNSVYQTVVWAMFAIWTAAHQVARKPPGAIPKVSA